MNHDLIDLVHASHADVFDDLEDAVYYQKLQYLASALEEAGFGSPDQVGQAISRAIQVCNNCGVPIREHFRVIYVADDMNHTVRRDWRLSSLGYSLVMLNGAADNPAVARAQIEMVTKYFMNEKPATQQEA